MNTHLFAALALGAVCVSGGAQATVYQLTGQDIGAATATGTITTDGVIGMLALADITDFSLTLAAPGETTTQLTRTNASLDELSGPGLTATTTGLFFSFEPSVSSSLIWANTASSYCLSTSNSVPGCYLIANNQRLISFFDKVYPESLADGVVQIAAVPEPGAWALMLAGFALVGVAARARETSARARPAAC